MSRHPLVFVHSSDELYGADRMLLELVDAVPERAGCQVWLPTDLPHPAAPLCAELARRGVHVRHLDLPVLRRAYRTPRALAALAVRTRRLTAELRRTAPGIVYCTTSAAYLGAHSARRAGVPQVVGHVQEFWSGRDALVLAPLVRHCGRVIAISAAVAEALPGPVRARAQVVPNATPDPGPASSLSGRTGPLHYLVASRWNGWKGHRTLLAAWERAGAPGRLTVLGAAPPVGDAVDVAALVAGLSDAGSVDIVGEVPDPHRFIEAADVLVVPSDEPEPFGLVAIEAFARGRPVLASAAGGLAGIVTDGRDGWLFAPKDVGALAARLAALTRDDVTTAGASARRTYESAYSVDRYRRQWRAAVFG
jgi:glycosyltransferase involved in cell wall biosynthesis